MTLQPIIKFVEYLGDGVVLESHDVDVNSVPVAAVEAVGQKIARLSGSLELPLEFAIEGQPDAIVRVCSDFKTMYSVYYFDEVACLTSLTLPGVDPESESELIQVFRALLLSDSDNDEITDEEWETIEAEGLFDFNAIEERPVTLQTFLMEPEEGAEEEQILFDQFREIDRALTIAFLDLPQVKLESD